MALQRLQKILAQAGVASRRAAEHLITEGRVRVNGRVVSELGARANPLRDRVEVDGKRLVAEKPVYYLMHKPRGVVTTLDDPEGRKSISDLLRNVPERVFPVGRLDFQTSGALLLTNDGAMAQALLHPTRSVPKTYHAKIQGSLDDKRLELLRSGVTLDDGEVTRPAEVHIVRQDDRHTFIEVTITEGKNRQIHRMLDAVGRNVLRLTRTAFAGLPLDSLRPGQMRPLLSGELNDLKQKYLNPSKKLGKPRGASETWGEEEEELPRSRWFEEEAARGARPHARAVRGGARSGAASGPGGRGGARRDAASARQAGGTGGGARSVQPKRGAHTRQQHGAARLDVRTERSAQTRQRRGKADASPAHTRTRTRRDNDADERTAEPRARKRGKR